MFSAWFFSISSVAAEPKCALSDLIYWGSAWRFVMPCRWQPGRTSGWLKWFGCWFRWKPCPCSSWGDGLRGDDVNLIQVILGKVLVISKWVIKDHSWHYFIFQASKSLSWGAVHSDQDKRLGTMWINSWQLWPSKTCWLTNDCGLTSFHKHITKHPRKGNTS